MYSDEAYDQNQNQNQNLFIWSANSNISVSAAFYRSDANFGFKVRCATFLQISESKPNKMFKSCGIMAVVVFIV